ncbi:MAG: TIGR02757 family protein [Actinobacteria bacterium]|nr:TIGR02757 family protein [Actinomycetota bacterium]
MNAVPDKLDLYIESLEGLYNKYNRREFVHPDPLEFLYSYDELADREIVALIASLLAYGKVAQILKSVGAVLERMGPSPAEFLAASSDRSLVHELSGFKHRMTTGQDLARVLEGAKRVIERYGSLNGCFVSGIRKGDETVIPALSSFVAEISEESGGSCEFHLPSPDRGSACKRLNLFLRWLVRKDEVDPGGWEGVPPSKLVVPLDTHMHKICFEHGLTKRRQADLRTALEITSRFRGITPDDPVKYDFALTRLGIRDDASFDQISG